MHLFHNTQVLVRGSRQAAESLGNYCRNSKDIQGSVFIPKLGEIMDATTESHIYQVTEDIMIVFCKLDQICIVLGPVFINWMPSILLYLVSCRIWGQPPRLLQRNTDLNRVLVGHVVI